MGENIEVKDVQKTEYLDKNGLDMLWAKVKENTHNQVEVEYNRAKAKEDSLSQEIASAKPAEGKSYIQAKLTSKEQDGDECYYDVAGDISFKSEYSDSYGGPITCINKSGIGITFDNDPTFGSTGLLHVKKNNSYNITMQGRGRLLHDTRDTFNEVSIKLLEDADTTYANSNGGNSMLISQLGIFYTSQNYALTSNDLLTGHGGYKTIGTDIAPLENGKVPAEYLDLSQYAKKSEITAGGNVDDVQVNGVSVVENKIANIKPATKEEYGVVKVGDGLNVTDGTISVDKSSILIDLLSYGVEWDTTVSDPACTRIGNMSYHKSLPIQSEYKGCLVKNGKVNYYLDPNDWSKKADGTPSVLDGTDGDVMVHIPKFYGKSGSNRNKRWVRIATTKIDSSWVEIPEMFVSAYRITTFDDSGTLKIASVVNTTANYRGGDNNADYDQYLASDKFRTNLGKPRTNVSRATMRTNASNSGQELLCYEFYKWVFYWAYVIEYANFNSQKEFNSELTSNGYHQGGLGSGLTTIESYTDLKNYNSANPITPCGYTNEFGNFSGTKSIPANQSGLPVTVTANRWRGFENPFGDIETILDGIIINRDDYDPESKVYTTSDSSKFGEDRSLMNFVGTTFTDRYFENYIREFDLGETGEIIPNKVNATTSTYKCDKYTGQNGYGTTILFVGGNALDHGNAGLCSLNVNEWKSYESPLVGFRSVIRV